MIEKSLMIVGFVFFVLHLFHSFGCFLIDESEEDKCKGTSNETKREENP
jgi:hypothetical protein